MNKAIEDDYKYIWERVLKSCSKMKWKDVFNPKKKKHPMETRKGTLKSLNVLGVSETIKKLEND